MSAKISGVGQYLPKRILTNHDLEKMVQTSDEWIRSRVGIVSRHIADEEETNVFMATQAAKEALEMAGVSPSDLDLIIVATSTPDYMMPSTAVLVQSALKATCPAFDINAACSGFIYGLDVAYQYFNNKRIKHVLVIGSERMSRVINWKDRSTCVIFADGAGAVLLSASDTPHFLASEIGADGQYRDLLYIEQHLPSKPFTAAPAESFIIMEGNKVFKHAVNMLEEIVVAILEKHHLKKSDITWLIPHQANERIIAATAKKLDLTMDNVILTLTTHGNTSAATIPLALAEGIKSGRIKRGDLLLLEAFGAGFTWGASLIRY